MAFPTTGLMNSSTYGANFMSLVTLTSMASGTAFAMPIGEMKMKKPVRDPIDPQSLKTWLRTYSKHKKQLGTPHR